MKLLTRAIENKLAKTPLYSTDGKKEKAVIVKFFTPDAGYSFYVTEGEKSPETGDWEFFGYVTLTGGYPEWTYFRLSDLRTIRGNFGLPIERDRHAISTITMGSEPS